MNQLLETIEWAHLMGFDTKRTDFAHSHDSEMGYLLTISIGKEAMEFWFDYEGELVVTELL